MFKMFTPPFVVYRTDILPQDIKRRLIDVDNIRMYPRNVNGIIVSRYYEFYKWANCVYKCEITAPENELDDLKKACLRFARH